MNTQTIEVDIKDLEYILTGSLCSIQMPFKDDEEHKKDLLTGKIRDLLGDIQEKKCAESPSKTNQPLPLLEINKK